jgi:hypothetical protein
LAAQGLQGLHGLAAAQGLTAWQGLAAAQGLQGLQALIFFLAAQGLQGLQAAAQGLQAAICRGVSPAWLAAMGRATAPAETVATLSATKVFFSMEKPPSIVSGRWLPDRGNS